MYPQSTTLEHETWSRRRCFDDCDRHELAALCGPPVLQRPEAQPQLGGERGVALARRLGLPGVIQDGIPQRRRVSSPSASRASQPPLEAIAVHGATLARLATAVTTVRGEDLRMKSYKPYGAAAMLAFSMACGASESTQNTQVDQTESALSTDDDAPEADDPEDFARRFAAVSEIVGEDAARRVMANAATRAVPVYSLALDANTTVDWYELVDGFVSVALVGSTKSELTKLDDYLDLPPSEIFVALAPDQDVPPVLRELDQRVVEMAPIYAKLAAAADAYTDVALPREPESDVDIEKSAPVPELGKLSSAMTSATCLNLTSCDDGGWNWAVIQQNRTSDAKILRYDVYRVVAGIGCALAGQLTYRVRYQEWFTWTTWFAYDLTVDQYVSWGNLNLNYDFDFEGRLYNFGAGASGTQCAQGSN
jgi:hypothetical protein